ncbi:ABC transporter substrate-binding protein [Roseomonas sp. CCTCC AB2023176]|uniref:ABC transporter substrate-binding protein n=1 Tax=Roseomonas sp. CCTCC AB2023176 TaxID=3342640 RepID=UPI0035DDD717
MIGRRSFLAASVAAFPVLARAQDAATAVVDRFHATLLAVMRDARSLGIRGREQRVRAAMTEAFDLPAMARIAVGPGWTGFSLAQQEAVATAFADWSIATYASRFDGFSGESFSTGGTQALQNGDTLVRTTLNRPRDAAVSLNYLVRNTPRGLRIVDVYLTGTISELASRRSEFAAILRDGGPDRLAAELRQRTAGLLRG